MDYDNYYDDYFIDDDKQGRKANIPYTDEAKKEMEELKKMERVQKIEKLNDRIYRYLITLIEVAACMIVGGICVLEIINNGFNWKVIAALMAMAGFKYILDLINEF